MDRNRNAYLRMDLVGLGGTNGGRRRVWILDPNQLVWIDRVALRLAESQVVRSGGVEYSIYQICLASRLSYIVWSHMHSPITIHISVIPDGSAFITLLFTYFLKIHRIPSPPPPCLKVPPCLRLNRDQEMMFCDLGWSQGVGNYRPKHLW